MGGVSTRQMQNAGAAWLCMDRPTGTGASLAEPRALPRGEGARV
jgi:hypothetical protein